MKHVKPRTMMPPLSAVSEAPRIPWCLVPVKLGLLVGVDKYCDPITPG